MGHFEKILFFVVALVTVAYSHTVHELNNGAYQLMTHGDVANKSIHFYISVNTTGWVGVGVGPNPNMTNADLVVGGINDTDSSPYYTDMHATGNTRPLNDDKTVSDWVWVSGNQTTTGGVNTTHIEFKRLFKTTDTNTGQDYEIKNENLYLLMAYGQNDTFGYHIDNNRNWEEVNLCKEAAGACNPGSVLNSMTVLLSICIAAAVKIIF